MNRYYMLPDDPAKQFSFNGYPAVRIFSTRATKNISKDQFKLTDAWTEFFKAQNSARGWQYLYQPQAGVLFARWTEKVINIILRKKQVTVTTLPKDQSLGFFTNVISGNPKGQFVQVRTLMLQDGPPSISEVNYTNTPDLVHKFTVERRDGSIVGPPLGGIDVFVPIVSSVPVYVAASFLRQL